MKHSSFNTNTIRNSIYFLFSFVLILFFTACDTVSKTETTVEEATAANPDVHVAFAGGGWRAHTGHTAWVASLMHYNQKNGCTLPSNGGNPACLNSAFGNVFTISGNSGG